MGSMELRTTQLRAAVLALVLVSIGPTAHAVTVVSVDRTVRAAVGVGSSDDQTLSSSQLGHFDVSIDRQVASESASAMQLSDVLLSADRLTVSGSGAGTATWQALPVDRIGHSDLIVQFFCEGDATYSIPSASLTASGTGAASRLRLEEVGGPALVDEGPGAVGSRAGFLAPGVLYQLEVAADVAFAVMEPTQGDASWSLALEVAESPWTIGFDDLTGDPDNYTEDGFLLTNPSSLHAVDDPSVPDPPAALTSQLGSTTTLTGPGGAPFALVSIDLSEVDDGGTPLTVHFTGEQAGGGSVAYDATTDGVCCGAGRFQTFSFPPGFGDVTAVHFDAAGTVFDDIRIDLAPEPGAGAAAAAALAVLALLGRGRGRSARAARPDPPARR